MWRALKHADFCGDLCGLGQQLYRTATSPDDGNPFVVQIHLMLPARRVKQRALKRIQTFYVGQIRPT